MPQSSCQFNLVPVNPRWCLAAGKVIELGRKNAPGFWPMSAGSDPTSALLWSIRRIWLSIFTYLQLDWARKCEYLSVVLCVLQVRCLSCGQRCARAAEMQWSVLPWITKFITGGSTSKQKTGCELRHQQDRCRGSDTDACNYVIGSFQLHTMTPV